jgi:hypothetical protein
LQYRPGAILGSKRPEELKDSSRVSLRLNNRAGVETVAGDLLAAFGDLFAASRCAVLSTLHFGYSAGKRSELKLRHMLKLLKL